MSRFFSSAFAFLLISSCVLVFPFTASAATDTESFVTTQGTKFMLNGHEFKFVGFNLFDAAATDRYKCGWWPRFTDQELDTAFKYMRDQGGVTVIRFWAFQKYTDSGRDWSGVDKAIRIAKQNGMKVIPVIENGPSHCTGDQTKQKWQYQSDTWYTAGYKVPFGTDSVSYRAYVQQIVTRYKDEPAILGWMMMNEADTSLRVNGKSALVEFSRDIGTLINSIDSKHLITVGTQSNGASGASGQDFVDVYGLSMIDFTEGHDWEYWSGNEADPLPGSSNGTALPDVNSPDCTKTYQAKIACSIANSVNVLNKPFVMGEAGVRADDNATSRQRRADIFDTKMRASFDNRVAGYLVWQWNTIIDSEKFDVLQRHNDPLLAKMKARAGYLPQLPGQSTPIPTTSSSPTPTPSRSPSPTPTPRPATPTPSPIISACGREDINLDKIIDITDYSILVSNFLVTPVYAPADIDNDGIVDITDYSLVVGKFLQRCP